MKYVLGSFEVLFSFRSVVGGQGTWRHFLTIPNILKEFNPKLFGFSLADSFTHHRESQFNIAEIGAMSQDLPFMTRQLVKRIKKDPRVDFNNDWKVTFETTAEASTYSRSKKRGIEFSHVL